MKKILITALALGLNIMAIAKDRIVTISTTKGDIKVKLYDDVPKHSDNFYKLAKEGFYNGTLFHRVIPQFMIQGGDPTSKTAKPGQMLGNGDNGYRVPAEFNTKYFHKRGALAAARDNNPQKESSGCQFYIVQGKKFTNDELNTIEKRKNITFSAEQRKAYTTEGGTPHLDGEYTVYGEVIEGMEVVDAIAAVPRDKSDRPEQDISMTMKVKKKKKFLFF
jgi:peptidyl-prolyl cis-trans isomerase B (cyclophilin B)